MTILTLTVKYLWGRFVASTLTAVSIALGVSLVVASVLLARGIKEGFIAGATDYNLVVGAKGSATQLVLGVVFRMDLATPNIPYTIYEGLREDRRVETAVPIGVGDAYRGFRYVATNSAYFSAYPWRRKAFTLAAGRFLADDPPDEPTYEALLGAEAARSTGLQIDDRFYEGEEMVEYPLTVVGILRPTHSADDRAIFLSLPTYWGMNEVARGMAVKPLTAVLVRPKQMSNLPSLHREINVAPHTQAVLPSGVILTIFNMMAVAEDVLKMILAIVGVIVLLYVFVDVQRYDGAPARDRHYAGAGREAGERSWHCSGGVRRTRNPRRRRRDRRRTCCCLSRRSAARVDRASYQSSSCRRVRAGGSRRRHCLGHPGRPVAGGARLPHGGRGESCATFIVPGTEAES